MNPLSEFDSLFDPAHPSFTEEGVERLLSLDSDEAEAARMEQLAEKANEGQLGEVERQDYETWVKNGALISLLRAKARLYRKSLATGA